jgi:ABC-type molybdenum transport system ATPase subunit/photorepair protein PhrA
VNLGQEAEEVEALAFRLNHLKRTVELEEKESKRIEVVVKKTQDAQEILQYLAQAVQQQAHQKISEVVSLCLSAVFGEDAYQFGIEFQRKRGKTEAVLKFKRGDLAADPLSATGGGVVDVAAFALRISCLMLHRPRLSRIVVLDEPFKFVSVQYREKVRTMLEELAVDLKIQIIQVTHSEELTAGKVIEL